MLNPWRVFGLLLSFILWVQVAVAADYLWTSESAGTPPAWIRQLPPNASMLGETRFEISKPPQDELALAVTLFYQEQEGGFLRVLWGQPGYETALTMNLYEGVGMESRRTLLLHFPPGATVSNLILQSFDPSTGLKRAYFQWIVPTTVYQPSDRNPIVLIDEYGEALQQEKALGWPEPLPKDEWRRGVTIAPLIERPERIEDGVAFIFELVKVPELARVELDISGLPPEWPCELWLNGLPAALLNVEVPSLTDPGYRRDAVSGHPIWVGWRKGSVLIPAELLQVGKNEIIFDFSSSNLTYQLPVAVRNLNLELLYDRPGEDEVESVNIPQAWQTGPAAVPPMTVVPGSPVQLDFLIPQLELMD